MLHCNIGVMRAAYQLHQLRPCSASIPSPLQRQLGHTRWLRHGLHVSMPRHVVVARLETLQNNNLQLIRFQDANAESRVEDELIQLPFDSLELLGLTDRDVYLHCDINKAYDQLLTAGIDEGYSTALLDARQDLLDLVKERAIRQEGRIEGTRRQLAIPVSLLPSALVLLAQLGHDDIVIDMANGLLENWEYRKVYKADLILALAVAYCNKARELLKEEQVAQGCHMLEEALHVLEASEPVAPALVKEIRGGLASLQGPRILDVLRGPLGPDTEAARRRAVHMLRMLTSQQPAADGSAGVVTADYVKLLVGAMSPQEILEMADWMEVARKDKGLPWAYPGLMLTAAAAYVVEGFTSRSPVKVKAALKLMRNLPSSAELQALRGVSCLLLGATEKAATAFREASKALPEAVVPWGADQGAAAAAVEPQQPQPPVARHHHQQKQQQQQQQQQEESQQLALEGEEYAGSPSYGEDEVASPRPASELSKQRLPDAVDAWAFVVANSPEAPADVLPGMCLYTQLWMTKAGFSMFRSTQEQQPNPSINSYFSSQRVQVALETMEQQADLSGATASMDSLGEKLQLVQERMQRLAASSLDTLRSQMVPAAGSAASSLVSRVAGALAPGMAAPDSPPSAATPEAGQAPSAAAGAGGLTEPAAGSRPVAMPELLPAEQDLLQQQQQKGGLQPVRMAVAAGVLAVGVIGAGWLWRAVSAAGSSNALPPAANVASRYPAMDVSGATKLIQQFQKAKARALGSEYDCSQLSSVLMGAALQQYHSTAQELAARGWFRTSRLWKCVVHRVTPVTASGQKVVAQATIGEEARTYGFDGQRATCTWNNAYDVDYEMTLCKGGAWRISRVTVRGKEPAGGGFKLPFFNQQ